MAFPMQSTKPNIIDRQRNPFLKPNRSVEEQYLLKMSKGQKEDCQLLNFLTAPIDFIANQLGMQTALPLFICCSFWKSVIEGEKGEKWKMIEMKMWVVSVVGNL